METLSRGADLSTSLLSAVRLNYTTLGFLRFGSKTMVDPGALGAYHVNVPVSGRVVSECAILRRSTEADGFVRRQALWSRNRT